MNAIRSVVIQVRLTVDQWVESQCVVGGWLLQDRSCRSDSRGKRGITSRTEKKTRFTISGKPVGEPQQRRP